MSIQSWKDEFYPTTANDCVATGASAAEHSLVKWTGLRAQNMRKHGVVPEPFGACITDNATSLPIDSSSCALCVKHADRSSIHECESCPLYQIRGGFSCDEAIWTDDVDEGTPPYLAWSHLDDPEPMIYWLAKLCKELSDTSGE